MFRASLAHHQEFWKLCLQPGLVFNYPRFCLSVCHVLYLCRVWGVLEWCALVDHWVVCTMIIIYKDARSHEHKKQHDLFCHYVIKYMFWELPPCILQNNTNINNDSSIRLPHSTAGDRSRTLFTQSLILSQDSP